MRTSLWVFLVCPLVSGAQVANHKANQAQRQAVGTFRASRTRGHRDCFADEVQYQSDAGTGFVVRLLRIGQRPSVDNCLHHAAEARASVFEQADRET